MPEQPKTLEEFLQKNNVCPETFQQKDPEYWQITLAEFNQLGAISFRQRKKFLINFWRKKYPTQ